MDPINKKPVYYNKVQQEIMFVLAHTAVIVAGRRTGKSHGAVAPRLLLNVQQMPRSAGAIVFPSYKRGLMNTLPATLKALEDLGYKRGIHFVVGIKPPEHFAKPYIEPLTYESVMTWYNGTVVYFISQDIPGSSNSLTLDWVMCDEAKFLDFDKLKDETFPANGGTTANFGHIPWHHGMMIVSDMPTTKKASWFLSYREKMDPEVIEVIKGLIADIYELQQKIADAKKFKQPVPAYWLTRLRKMSIELSQLRRVAVQYAEWSSIENLQVLGESYIKQMKRDLPPLVFQTSIMSKRITSAKDGFYSALIPAVHFYVRNNNSFLQGLQYNLLKAQSSGCLKDGDLDATAPICIAFDYNANINWLVCGQLEGIFLNILNSFYVKYENKLEELVNNFCDYYESHATKEIIFYYDSTAIGNNYALRDRDDFSTTVQKILIRRGWSVQMMYLGQQMKHHEKHLFINRLLKGQVEGGKIPRINEENNEPLILALEGAEVRMGTNGFQKNKAGEKLAETETDLLEHRTDGTDAFDTLVIGVNNMPYLSSRIAWSMGSL